MAPEAPHQAEYPRSAEVWADPWAEAPKAAAWLRAELEAMLATLPPLEGSEKQVAWATDLRQRTFEAVVALAKSAPRYAYGLTEGRMVAALKRGLAEPKAKAWIDGRSEGLSVWITQALVPLVPPEGCEIMGRTIQRRPNGTWHSCRKDSDAHALNKAKNLPSAVWWAISNPAPLPEGP